jgi:hypothetical protein
MPPPAFLRLAPFVILTMAIVACGGVGPGRLGERDAGGAAAAPTPTGAVDLESVFLGDELSPAEADALSGLDDLPVDPVPPAAESPSLAPDRSGLGDAFTTDAAQLLDAVEDTLRRLDAELAALDAAATQGE